MKGRAVGFPNVPHLELAEAASKGERGLEQLPKETGVAYRLFVQYCVQGPEVRAEDLAKSCGVSKGFVAVAKAKHHWIGRIEGWWRERERSAGVGSGGEEWENRRKALMEEEWKVHSALLGVAEEALRRWAAAKKVPNLGEVAKVLELASRLGRLAAGLPLAHMEVSGNPEAPLRVEIEAALERAYGREAVEVEAEVVSLEEARAGSAECKVKSQE